MCDLLQVHCDSRAVVFFTGSKEMATAEYFTSLHFADLVARVCVCVTVLSGTTWLSHIFFFFGTPLSATTEGQQKGGFCSDEQHFSKQACPLPFHLPLALVPLLLPSPRLLPFLPLPLRSSARLAFPFIIFPFSLSPPVTPPPPRVSVLPHAVIF